MALSDEGRRIVDAARAAYGPSDEDRERVAASLPLHVAAAAGTTWAGLLAGKGAVLGLATLVIVGSASVAYWRSLHGHPPRVAASAGAGPAPAATTTSHADQPRSTPSATAKEVEPPAPANRNRSPSRARVIAAKASPLAASPDVTGEIALLREAQRALASGQPDRALELLDRHAREFPRGSLTEERAAARIIALCALGRLTTARAEAAAFLRQSPASPLADRVRSTCGHGEN